MEEEKQKIVLSEEERANALEILKKLREHVKEDPYNHSTKDDLEKALVHIKELKNFIVRGQDYEAAASLRDLEKKIVTEIDKHILTEEQYLLSIKGIEIFGTSENFNKWLYTNNFYFDKKPPILMMDNIIGIKFINDRITGLNFGDNI